MMFSADVPLLMFLCMPRDVRPRPTHQVSRVLAPGTMGLERGRRDFTTLQSHIISLGACFRDPQIKFNCGSTFLSEGTGRAY